MPKEQEQLYLLIFRTGPNMIDKQRKIEIELKYLESEMENMEQNGWYLARGYRLEPLTTKKLHNDIKKAKEEKDVFTNN